MSKAAELPAGSREYLYVPVLPEEGSTDVTTLSVYFAFTANLSTYPDDIGWLAGAWKPGSTDPVARILVGPAGVVEFTPGTTRAVWLRVDGAIERPVRYVGQAKFT